MEAAIFGLSIGHEVRSRWAKVRRRDGLPSEGKEADKTEYVQVQGMLKILQLGSWKKTWNFLPLKIKKLTN